MDTNNISEDELAEEIFCMLSHIDSKFESFIFKFKNSFNKGNILNNIENFGLLLLQSQHELIKLAKKLKTTKNLLEKKNIVLNCIMLVYGYGAVFNQAIDNGFVAKETNRNVKKLAKKKGLDYLDIYYQIDRQYPSLLTKQFALSLKLIKNKKIFDDLAQLKNTKGFFDDGVLVKMDSVANKYVTKFEDIPLFSKYFSLFSEYYFPNLYALRLLIQTSKIPDYKQNRQGKALSQKMKKNKVVKQYIYLKNWKDISGVVANTNQLILYFGVFPLIFKDIGIELQAPIKEYVKKLAGIEFSALYNLKGSNYAQKKLIAWNNILGIKK